MKNLYAILFLGTALIVWVNGDAPPMPGGYDTNDWTQAVSPPSPVDSSGGGDLSNALYQASLRPTPRVLMSDGRIIKWTAEAIEWHVEAPYYRVEWREDLTKGEWITIAYRTGNRAAHGTPEGFYRVIPVKRPTLPPTRPASRHPTNSTVMMTTGSVTTGEYNGFIK